MVYLLQQLQITNRSTLKTNDIYFKMHKHY